MGALFSSVFSSLAFLSPGVFSALLLTPVLIFAYRRRAHSPSRPVSSLLFLRHFATTPKERARLKLPLRIILELLCLLLIIGAAAGPIFRPSGIHIAILFDTSLSMAAQVAPGVTRLERTREMLLLWMDSQPSDARYSLFTTPPFPQLSGSAIQPDTQNLLLSSSEARQKILALTPTYLPDSLNQQLTEIMSSSDFDQVVVAADYQQRDSQQGDSQNGTPQSNASAEIKKPLTLLSSFSSAPNPALLAASLAINSNQSEGATGTQAELTIGILHSPPALFNGTILIEDTAGRLLQKNAIRFSQPSKREEFIIPLRLDSEHLSQHAQSALALRVKLVTSGDNALSLDDEAWVVPHSTTNGRLLFVTQLKNPEVLGLSSIPRVSFSVITPEQYAEMTNDERRQYKGVIFHQSSPSLTPPIPTLLIAPPLSTPLIAVHSELAKPLISSWRDDHLVTRYLKPHLLSVSRSVVFERPSWGVDVISTVKGPVVAIGEKDGVRLGVVGFELFPFEGKKTPSPTVLLLNLLSWLSADDQANDHSAPQSLLSTALRTGDTLEAPAGERWVVTLPSNENITLPLPQSSTAQRAQRSEITQPGLVRVAVSRDGENSSSAPDRRLIPVNVSHPQESRTGVSQTIESAVAPGASSAAPQALERREWWRQLTWIVLVLLALDLILAAVRRGWWR